MRKIMTGEEVFDFSLILTGKACEAPQEWLGDGYPTGQCAVESGSQDRPGTVSGAEDCEGPGCAPGRPNRQGCSPPHQRELGLRSP